MTDFKPGTTQYIPDIDRQVLERKALFEGVVFEKNIYTTYFFYQVDKIVGYDNGQPTSWIRVELSGGEYHGHPISLERVQKYIKIG